MEKNIYSEYRILRERIDDIKKRINNKFSFFAGIKAEIEGKNYEENKRDCYNLIIESEKLERRIIELNNRNEDDKSTIDSIEESICVRIDDNDGRRIDEYYLTDDLSKEKKKLSDQLSENVKKRFIELSKLEEEKRIINRKCVVAHYSIYPFGKLLNNNYHAIDSLERAIQGLNLINEDNDLLKRFVVYNETLKNIKGIEEHFSDVIFPMIVAEETINSMETINSEKAKRLNKSTE